jgi:hypothetical protein
MQILTPEEARTKYCPYHEYSCHADMCMAWEWNLVTDYSKMKGSISSLTPVPEPDGKGFCSHGKG